MMKKIIALIFTALIATGVYAQSNKEDIDLIQAMYGKAKKELVIDYMKFNATEGAAFWTVYDAFENERKVLGRDRIKIIEDYANQATTLDEAKAADLGKRTLANNVALEKLNQKYFPKFSAAVGSVKAAKYMQLELYMQTTVRSELQDRLPLIDALDKTKKEIE